jgi:hypothetical protein
MPGRVPADRASSPTPGPTDSALGLDELMIVNPPPDGRGGIFLGEDGTLYQVQGLGAEEGAVAGALFLGEDGTLYRAEGVADPAATAAPPSPPPAASETGLSGYLLGADGTLYEITA